MLFEVKSKEKKPVGKVAQPPVAESLNPCHHTGMNKTNLFSTQNLTDLQDFMFDTMLPADDCVDWFCDRHEVNATDDVIDFVVDAHFAFHGN